MNKIELFNDHFQNFKKYLSCKAQLIIADPPYNLGVNAYASNPSWYVGGDNKNGESELAVARHCWHAPTLADVATALRLRRIFTRLQRQKY